uniref:Uncharacterized protein n=1 Tax=Opuntia streptacantha TaxID=393608 RepID=A0A7C9DX06_OPUST
MSLTVIKGRSLFPGSLEVLISLIRLPGCITFVEVTVSYCPVDHAFALVTKEAAFFYVDPQKVSPENLGRAVVFFSTIAKAWKQRVDVGYSFYFAETKFQT